MAWRFNGEMPVFKQIAQRLRMDIINGKYSPGEQFATVRTLALETAVNPNTVQKALQALEDEGLLETRGTVGKFVTSDNDAILRSKGRVQAEYVRNIVAQAEFFGISRDELAELIKKEDTDKNE